MRGRLRIRAFFVILAALLLCRPSESEAASKKQRKSANPKPAPVNFDPKLPVLGTLLLEFPLGDGKGIADQACLACHSTDMVRQQRLTEKQWAAEVTKMAVWGADIPQDKREELVAYLVNNFGPGAPKYEPVLTRPVGR
jgi:hypothetical protein